MTTEQVPEDLVSVRGLVDSEFGTPLRKFYGKLDSYPTEPAVGYAGTRVSLNFSDVEAIQSIEPYNFPIATLNIGLSNRRRSRWGVLGDSLAELIAEGEDIKHCIGRRIGMVLTDGQDGRPEPIMLYNGKTKQEEPVACWRVFEVAGVVAGARATTPLDQAKKFLDGRSLSDFNKAALADPIIRNDGELIVAITNKSFVNALVQTGEFTKDESDVYHKAVSE